MRIVEHIFAPADFIGGSLALDFVNTAACRGQDDARDWVDGYRRLLSWAKLTGAFASDDLRTLARLAAASPREAARGLGRARALREALHDVLLAVIQKREAPATSLAAVLSAWRAACRATSVEVAKGRIRVRLTAKTAGLDLIAAQVAVDSMALLEGADPSHLRRCEGSHCGWLFVDVSKSKRRRWCDMATCGNAAKARRHYARQRRSRPS
jgi:predicted RNA-binding Zn ribbon-like protein